MSLCDIDHSTAHIYPSIGSSDVTEDKLPGLSVHSRVIASSNGYFPAIRSSPRDDGWSKEILHWVNSAAEYHGFPTAIIRGGVT